MKTSELGKYKKAYEVLRILYARSIHSHDYGWGKVRTAIKECAELGEIYNAPAERDGYKYCTRCGKEKLLIEFNNRKDGKNGLHSECKTCRSYRRIRERSWIANSLIINSILDLADIPDELINRKRVELRLKRLIKEVKNKFKIEGL